MLRGHQLNNYLDGLVSSISLLSIFKITTVPSRMKRLRRQKVSLLLPSLLLLLLLLLTYSCSYCLLLSCKNNNEVIYDSHDFVFVVSAFIVFNNHHHHQRQRLLSSSSSLYPFTTPLLVVQQQSKRRILLRNSKDNDIIVKDDNDDNNNNRDDDNNETEDSSKEDTNNMVSSLSQLPLSKLPAVTNKKPYRPLGPKLTKFKRQRDNTIFRIIVQYLAELSLQDYQWRTNLFQQNEANRMMEESIARIRFGTTTTTTTTTMMDNDNDDILNTSNNIPNNLNYIRPMDAPALGPLGRLEKYYVSLLTDVFHEEQRRAQRIIASSGTVIRPSKNTIIISDKAEEKNDEQLPAGTYAAVSSSSSSSSSLLGPLGRLEAQVVAFFTSIQQEEMLRIRTRTWRPKDLPQRGPIGQLEYEFSTIIDDIRTSELIRVQQSKVRNDGTIVRPIDIPGPLGEIELRVSDIIQEEFRRVREKRNISSNAATINNNSNNNTIAEDSTTFTILRPKDATNPGPLGVAEAAAYATIQSVSNEEMERFKAIQRTLIEYRPINNYPTNNNYNMNTSSNDNENSKLILLWNKNPFILLLYLLETFVVGIFRAPQLVYSVLIRVQELLSSTPLDTNDIQIIQNQQQEELNITKTVIPPQPSSSTTTKDDLDSNNNNKNTSNNNNNNNPNHKPPPPQGEFL